MKWASFSSAFWRVALAAPLLWPLLALSPKGAARPDWRLLLAAGFAFAGDLGFWQGALRDRDDPAFQAAREAIAERRILEALEGRDLLLLHGDRVLVANHMPVCHDGTELGVLPLERVSEMLK